MSGIQFYKHTIDDDCIKAFGEQARSLFLTTGPATERFEKAFAAYLGLPYAIGVMSCTHALHLIYTAMGIGPGDEVVVPAFTFAATATAVMHAGATPVFADVDPQTGIVTTEAVEAVITPRTKAICVVHLYGVMAPMERFQALATQHGLRLVEDAAHCIEGRGPGYAPGTLGDAAAFSFYATKNITCGEGGAIATRHANLAESVGRLRTHGMNKNAISRYTGKFSFYDIVELGYKCNLTDLQSALLLPQLEKIEALLARRAAIAERYDAALKDVRGISLPFIPKGSRSARHLYTIRVSRPEKRDEFLAAMIDAGVNCSVHYRPLASLTLFREKLGMKHTDFPLAEAIGNSTVTLPLYPSLTGAEADIVVEAVRKTARQMLD